MFKVVVSNAVKLLLGHSFILMKNLRKRIVFWSMRCLLGSLVFNLRILEKVIVFKLSIDFKFSFIIVG